MDDSLDRAAAIIACKLIKPSFCPASPPPPPPVAKGQSRSENDTTTHSHLHAHAESLTVVQFPIKPLECEGGRCKAAKWKRMTQPWSLVR